jgi:hypothetical protein
VGTLEATSIVRTGGTSSQFLKADGSVDNNTYATTSALSGYLPLSGGTLTGALNGTSAAFSGNLQTSGVLTVGNQSVAGNYFLQITPSTTNKVSLQAALAGTGISDIVMQPSGGNVGIGTTSPTSLLTVVPSNDAAEAFRIYRGSSGGYQSQSAIIDAVSGDFNIRSLATDNARGIVFSFSTNGSSSYTERMRITSGGNVGIGTISPSAKLDVAGAATFSSSVTATEGLFGGAVTNGVDKLRVNGNISTSQLITGSFYPNMTLRNTATTLSSLYTTVIADNGSTNTYTLDAASGHNRIYIIRAVGIGTTITLNRSGSDVIVNNAGSNVTSLNIIDTTGAVWVQSDGTGKYIQLK